MIFELNNKYYFVVAIAIAITTVAGLGIVSAIDNADATSSCRGHSFNGACDGAPGTSGTDPPGYPPGGGGEQGDLASRSAPGHNR